MKIGAADCAGGHEEIDNIVHRGVGVRDREKTVVVAEWVGLERSDQAAHGALEIAGVGGGGEGGFFGDPSFAEGSE